jgi:hypothetical protein
LFCYELYSSSGNKYNGYQLIWPHILRAWCIHVGSVVPILPFVALTLLFDAEPTRWQWGGIALVVEALLEVIFGRKILQD